MPKISFNKLHRGDERVEKDVLEACREVGFFLLDLRGDELGVRIIHEIDQLFIICEETMTLPGNIKEQHRNDIPSYRFFRKTLPMKFYCIPSSRTGNEGS
ncbi:hypothetical protein F5Y08DRAFT_305569 [Xylaria arbuscula]|nr:hypothetical protein F5Y08DRAFT_305569 [Xylaria arbuscula]